MLDAITLEKFCSDPSTVARGSSKGSGLYSKVYEGPLPGTVIKYGRTLKDGWLFYAAWVMSRKHRPSYMPRIIALHIDTQKGEFHAIIEALHETYGEENPPNWTGYFDSIREDHGRNVPAEIRENFLTQIDHICAFTGTSQPFWLDAHSGNWMRRAGGSLVLTDPFVEVSACTMDHVRKLAPKCGDKITIV